MTSYLYQGITRGRGLDSRQRIIRKNLPSHEAMVDEEGGEIIIWHFLTKTQKALLIICTAKK